MLDTSKIATLLCITKRTVGTPANGFSSRDDCRASKYLNFGFLLVIVESLSVFDLFDFSRWVEIVFSKMTQKKVGKCKKKARALTEQDIRFI